MTITDEMVIGVKVISANGTVEILNDSTMYVREVRNDFIINYNQLKYDILFDGIASTLNTSYTLNKDISSYRALIVYGGYIPSSSSLIEQIESIFIVKDMISPTTDSKYKFSINVTIIEGNRRLLFYFPSKTTFKITTSNTTSSGIMAICKIIGIK